MDIKILPDNAGLASVETESKTADASSAASSVSSSSVESDPVTRIADDIASGRITVEQGVDQIVGEILSGGMVASAPESLRSEIAEMLRVALDTDPSLMAMMNRLRQ